MGDLSCGSAVLILFPSGFWSFQCKHEASACSVSEIVGVGCGEMLQGGKAGAEGRDVHVQGSVRDPCWGSALLQFWFLLGFGYCTCSKGRCCGASPGCWAGLPALVTHGHEMFPFPGPEEGPQQHNQSLEELMEPWGSA